MGLTSASLKPNRKDSAFFCVQLSVTFCARSLVFRRVTTPSFTLLPADGTWAIARFCYYKRCCCERSCPRLLPNRGKCSFGCVSRRGTGRECSPNKTIQILLKVAKPIYTPTDTALKTASNLYLSNTWYCLELLCPIHSCWPRVANEPLKCGQCD